MLATCVKLPLAPKINSPFSQRHFFDLFIGHSNNNLPALSPPKCRFLSTSSPEEVQDVSEEYYLKDQKKPERCAKLRCP
jgi:hypothetical protein